MVPLTDGMSESAYPFDLADNTAASFLSVLNSQEIRIIDLKAQGYKHREISDVLGIRPGTVDSAISRIKAKITEFLED
jgi:DNA-directed RNA polymerase specialized sigma24 family protein